MMRVKIHNLNSYSEKSHNNHYQYAPDSRVSICLPVATMKKTVSRLTGIFFSSRSILCLTSLLSLLLLQILKKTHFQTDSELTLFIGTTSFSIDTFHSDTWCLVYSYSHLMQTWAYSGSNT